MDKFDYITATIEEEKVRLEKIIEIIILIMMTYLNIKKDITMYADI